MKNKAMILLATCLLFLGCLGPSSADPIQAERNHLGALLDSTSAALDAVARLYYSGEIGDEAFEDAIAAAELIYEVGREWNKSLGRGIVRPDLAEQVLDLMEDAGWGQDNGN